MNNQPATVAVLRLLAPHLATIHAQNESMLSFDGPARLGLLDTFAGSQLEDVERGYEAWKGIHSLTVVLPVALFLVWHFGANFLAVCGPAVVAFMARTSS